MTSAKICKKCRWYDLDHASCGKHQSEWFGRLNTAVKSCECYEVYNSNEYNDYWKREAQTQTAAAGELKINIAYYLEELKVQRAALCRLLALEDNDFDQVILQWKIKQTQQHIERLETILYGQSSTADH